MSSLETCANCDRSIGKLETPHVYKGEIVCAACHEILSRPSTPQNHGQTVQAAPVATPAVARTTDAVVGRVLLILFLLGFIGVCVLVILMKMSTW